MTGCLFYSLGIIRAYSLHERLAIWVLAHLQYLEPLAAFLQRV